MQYKTAKRLCSDMKYLQMTDIEVHKILQVFQGTHIAERTRTHQGSFIKDCSKVALIIYSVP